MEGENSNSPTILASVLSPEFLLPFAEAWPPTSENLPPRKPPQDMTRSTNAIGMSTPDRPQLPGRTQEEKKRLSSLRIGSWRFNSPWTSTEKRKEMAIDVDPRRRERVARHMKGDRDKGVCVGDKKPVAIAGGVELDDDSTRRKSHFLGYCELRGPRQEMYQDNRLRAERIVAGAELSRSEQNADVAWELKY
ncbi:hypothetical protein GALMADRAFT_216801 [Galerina marginata CBS 339.88]|uniref:Uncharacterized protein n=1 Tax=Galerina marginata (strain CBS 339.88) TaxID=685588 RepID=A0A067SJP8_GALM3|nr:hypothetical protein GALMADRAFT_216801 [Galerina marginata CBS 339.88]